MPPTCETASTTNATTAATTSDIDDRNALLYIVVTLLFYSMGIVIGIITYLKREQAEMEEDKMFEVYLHMKREPFNLHKQERVNQMALYLKQIEDRKMAQENFHRLDGGGSEQQLHHPLCPHQLQHQQIQQQQSQQDLQPDSQFNSETQRHSAPLPCSFCHAGENFSDPHHLQPLLSRSRHSSGRETPAGTPAVLCSLTLNVCEPFLSPEMLPKAALPFRPPTPRDRGQSPFQCHSQVTGENGSGPDHSAFKDSASVTKTPTSTSDAAEAMCQMQPMLDADFSTHRLCSSEEYLRSSKSNDKIGAHNNDCGKMMELKQLGCKASSSEERNHNVFQAPCRESLPYTKNVIGSQINDINNDDDVKIRAIPMTSSALATASPSPPLYSRSLSTDEVPISAGRKKLKRQLSLHTERSVSPSNRPTRLSGLGSDGIEEEDLRPLKFSDSDCSVACESMKTDKTNAEIDVDSDDRAHECQELCDKFPYQFNDRRCNSPPAMRRDMYSLGPIPVSYSDPLLPHRVLLSPQTCVELSSVSKPQDARPKVYSALGSSDTGGPSVSVNRSPSPSQGRGRLRKTILDAWRENGPQSVDVSEISKLSKTTASNTSFPTFLKTKSQLPQQEAAKSISMRAPVPREERRGALFLSQKSLLHASGTSPKLIGEPRTAPQSRVGSGHRSVLPRQVSLDCSATSKPDRRDTSFVPLLDPLQALDQDVSTVTNLPSSHRDQQSKIPKLSRARTVDTSSILEN
ncbi:hypothetical protein RRG08_046323 [Elysia crispata]|uniref:Uncharacterized protein n=1 Tax=Elysia crispata TaxID=231223 RepID=A0AAE1DS93_9GAST|nr:hypothetical protein RRG08_046323 [Elysia crispata]